MQPYTCKISGATFHHPCSVTTCFAHVRNLNASGVKVEPVTNCAHVDFHLAGFVESLDYAVVEQGNVGYRDLEYIASFMGVSAMQLREIYTSNVEMLKRTIAILWAAKNDHTSVYCPNCGIPRNEPMRCRSVSICEERRHAVSTVIEPMLGVIPVDDVVRCYNVVWRSLRVKFNPEIFLTSEERFLLSEL